MFTPLRLALLFLTRLPVPAPGSWSDRELGHSLLYYPLVGLLLGLLLAAGARSTAGADPLLAAALLLTLWEVVTGGLHLDGLADSADAWLGGQGERERSLAIMKDPASGPAGVAAVVLTLLLKWSALAVLLRAGAWWLLPAAPLLGRGALLPLFLTTPYVRTGGLGEALARHLPRRAARYVLLVVVFAVAALGNPGLAMLALAIPLFFALRGLMLSRLGGATGDTAGALVELVEAAALIGAALLY